MGALGTEKSEAINLIMVGSLPSSSAKPSRIFRKKVN
jgi:hypothetical protein